MAEPLFACFRMFKSLFADMICIYLILNCVDHNRSIFAIAQDPQQIQWDFVHGTCQVCPEALLHQLQVVKMQGRGQNIKHIKVAGE